VSLTSTINTKRAAYLKENPDSSAIGFLFHALAGFWRVFLAKIYLRKCTKLGRMVSVNGKPVIGNQGEIVLGDEVRVWSTIVQAKLYTGKNGKLIVGRNSRLNGVHIDARELIQIGENVRIAPYTIILDSDFHDLKDHFSDGASQPIIIEDDVWLATRCTILKGVRIGKGAVVATGAVVTKDVPPRSVVAGVPAKVIKTL
jgi:maltose O-acetyltransferase